MSATLLQPKQTCNQLVKMVRSRPIDETINRNVVFQGAAGDRFSKFILGYRDLCKEPLSLEEFLESPFEVFGRYVLETIDGPLLLGPEAKLQLVHIGPSKFELTARPFTSQTCDRKLLINLAERFVGKEFPGGGELFVAATGLSIVNIEIEQK